MVIEKTLRFPKPHPFPSLHQKRYPNTESLDLDRIQSLSIGERPRCETRYGFGWFQEFEDNAFGSTSSCTRPRR